MGKWEQTGTGAQNKTPGPGMDVTAAPPPDGEHEDGQWDYVTGPGRCSLPIWSAVRWELRQGGGVLGLGRAPVLGPSRGRAAEGGSRLELWPPPNRSRVSKGPPVLAETEPPP